MRDANLNIACPLFPCGTLSILYSRPFHYATFTLNSPISTYLQDFPPDCGRIALPRGGSSSTSFENLRTTRPMETRPAPIFLRGKRVPLVSTRLACAVSGVVQWRLVPTRATLMASSWPVPTLHLSHKRHGGATTACATNPWARKSSHI